MNRKCQVIEEEGASSPAYLVTFGALVVLLMLFFVMLLSLSSSQDEGLFGRGREAFLRSIGSFGLGMFYGKKQRPDFGEEKIKYFIKKPDELFDVRSIDAKGEELRQTFKNIARSMKSTPSQIVAKKTNFSVTNISFAPEQASLNEPATKFLTRFAADLQEGGRGEAIKLYVLGLAGDSVVQKEQWILSAKRSQAVSDFLRSILPTELGWPVYSWGAGPGGLWVSENSSVSAQSQILIAVLRGENN